MVFLVADVGGIGRVGFDGGRGCRSGGDHSFDQAGKVGSGSDGIGDGLCEDRGGWLFLRELGGFLRGRRAGGQQVEDEDVKKGFHGDWRGWWDSVDGWVGGIRWVSSSPQFCLPHIGIRLSKERARLGLRLNHRHHEAPLEKTRQAAPISAGPVFSSRVGGNSWFRG